MNGPNTHLMQSCEKVLGHINRLFEALQPVIDGTHSVLSERDQMNREESLKASEVMEK